MIVGFLILLPVAILLASIVVLGIGLRGRVIDDHPICRKCGYDLHGLPESSGRCSECGSDLKSTNAIRKGHRQRRWRMVSIGAAFSVLMLVYLSTAAWVTTRDADLRPYKPVWWLTMEARGKAPQRALAELTARLTVGKLSPGQVRSVAQLALDIQQRSAAQSDGWFSSMTQGVGDVPASIGQFLAKGAPPWDPAWGDFIEQAQKAGTVPPELWTRYLNQSLRVDWRIRPIVRKGDPLPIYWAVEFAQGSAGKLRCYMRLRLQLEDQQIDISFQRTSTKYWLGGRTGDKIGTYIPTDFAVIHNISEGKHDVKLIIDANLYYGITGDTYAELLAPPPNPVGTTHIELPGTLTLTGTDSPTVKLISDPQYQGAMRAAVSVSATVASAGVVNADHDWLELTINIAPGLPVGLAHSVLLRNGTREWNPNISSITLPAGGGGWRTTFSGQIKDFTADRADVILRPNLDLAARTFDIDSIWNEEIILKDVTVMRKK